MDLGARPSPPASRPRTEPARTALTSWPHPCAETVPLVTDLGDAGVLDEETLDDEILDEWLR